MLKPLQEGWWSRIARDKENSNPKDFDSNNNSITNELSKWSLCFLQNTCERTYRQQWINNSAFRLRWIIGLLFFGWIITAIAFWILNNQFVIAACICIPVHFIAFFIFTYSPTVEVLLGILVIFNQISYDYVLKEIPQITIEYTVLAEFLLFAVLSIFLRTRLFLIDLGLLISTRVLHTAALDTLYKDTNLITLAVLLVLEVLFIGTYFYESELNARDKFYQQFNDGKWAEIVEKVMPVSVIVSKFNPRTCEIILGSCNQACQKNFRISDNSTYYAMLDKMKISGYDVEPGTTTAVGGNKTLRDYMLTRHFTVDKKKKNNTKANNKNKHKATLSTEKDITNNGNILNKSMMNIERETNNNKDKERSFIVQEKERSVVQEKEMSILIQEKEKSKEKEMSIVIQDNNNNNNVNTNGAGNILNSRYGLQDISNKPILSSENTNNVVLADQDKTQVAQEKDKQWKNISLNELDNTLAKQFSQANIGNKENNTNNNNILLSPPSKSYHAIQPISSKDLNNPNNFNLPITANNLPTANNFNIAGNLMNNLDKINNITSGVQYTGMNAINNPNSNIQCILGTYKETESSLGKRYKISVVDGESCLVICLEDKSFKSTLNSQKQLYTTTNAMFSRTLAHFQLLVRSAISTLNQASTKFIPALLLYNTLLLNMQIHNITDYIKLKSQSKSSSSNNAGKNGNIVFSAPNFNNQMHNQQQIHQGLMNSPNLNNSSMIANASNSGNNNNNLQNGNNSGGKIFSSNNHLSNNHIQSHPVLFQGVSTPRHQQQQQQQYPNLNNLTLDRVLSNEQQQQLNPTFNNNEQQNNNISRNMNPSLSVDSLQLEMLELSEFLNQLDKLMKKVCSERKVKFIMLNETTLDQMIITDKNKLYRILVNYIANSIKNTAKGYIQLKVIAGTSLGIPTIKFELIDSGCGMSTKENAGAAGVAGAADFKSNLNLDLGLDQENENNKQQQQLPPLNLRQLSKQQSQNDRKQQQQASFRNSPQKVRVANLVNNGVVNTSFSMEDSNMMGNNNNEIPTNNNNIMENSTGYFNQNPCAPSVNPAKKMEGLGIGMIVSKYLVNSLGPSFPKVFSKKGLGTNITFEVYTDLKAVNAANLKLNSNTNPLISTTNNGNGRRHHGSSFSLFHSSGVAMNSAAIREAVLREAILNNNLPGTTPNNGVNVKYQENNNDKSYVKSEKAINEKQQLNTQQIPSQNTNGGVFSTGHVQQQYGQSSSGFGGSVDYLLNTGAAELKALLFQRQLQQNLQQQLPIQLDAEENVDEEALEFKNLGGSCYKMFGTGELNFNIQKNDRYLILAKDGGYADPTDPCFSSTGLLQNYNNTFTNNNNNTTNYYANVTQNGRDRDNTHFTGITATNNNPSIFQSTHYGNPVTNTNIFSQGGTMTNINTNFNTNNNNFNSTNAQYNTQSLSNNNYIKQSTINTNTFDAFRNNNNNNQDANSLTNRITSVSGPIQNQPFETHFRPNENINNNHSDMHLQNASSLRSRTSSKLASLTGVNSTPAPPSFMQNPSNPSQLLPLRLPSSEAFNPPPHFGTRQQSSSTLNKRIDKDPSSNSHFANNANNNSNVSSASNAFNQINSTTFNQNLNQNQFIQNTQSNYPAQSNNYASVNNTSANQFTLNTNTFFNSTHIAQLNQQLNYNNLNYIDPNNYNNYNFPLQHSHNSSFGSLSKIEESTIPKNTATSGHYQNSSKNPMFQPSQQRWSAQNFNAIHQHRPSSSYARKKTRKSREKQIITEENETQIVCSSPDFLDPNSISQTERNPKKQVFLMQIQQYKLQKQLLEQQQQQQQILLQQQQQEFSSQNNFPLSSNNSNNNQDGSHQLQYQQQQYSPSNTHSNDNNNNNNNNTNSHYPIPQGMVNSSTFHAAAAGSEASNNSFIQALKPALLQSQQQFHHEIINQAYVYPQVSHTVMQHHNGNNNGIDNNYNNTNLSNAANANSNQRTHNNNTNSNPNEFNFSDSQNNYDNHNFNNQNNHDAYQDDEQFQKVSSELNRIVLGQNPPSNRKLKTKSSFNLIFDVKTNGNEEFDGQNNNAVMSNHNLLLSELGGAGGSQSNLTLSSSHSPGKQTAQPKRNAFSLLGDSATNIFKDQNGGGGSGSNQQVGMSHNIPSSSLNSPNKPTTSPYHYAATGQKKKQHYHPVSEMTYSSLTSGAAASQPQLTQHQQGQQQYTQHNNPNPTITTLSNQENNLQLSSSPRNTNTAAQTLSNLQPQQQSNNFPISNMSPFDGRHRISSTSSPSPLVFNSLQFPLRNHSSSTSGPTSMQQQIQQQQQLQIQQQQSQAQLQQQQQSSDQNAPYSPSTEIQLFPVNAGDLLFDQVNQSRTKSLSFNLKLKDKDQANPSVKNRTYRISIGGANELNVPAI